MQFTVYRNGDERSRAHAPYLLDVQSDLLAGARTCVVVPLILPNDAGACIERLMPAVEVDGQVLLMDTLQLAGVPRRILGPAVGNLSEERGRIVGALDMLVSGI